MPIVLSLIFRKNIGDSQTSKVSLYSEEEKNEDTFGDCGIDDGNNEGNVCEYVP